MFELGDEVIIAPPFLTGRPTGYDPSKHRAVVHGMDPGFHVRVFFPDIPEDSPDACGWNGSGRGLPAGRYWNVSPINLVVVNDNGIGYDVDQGD